MEAQAIQQILANPILMERVLYNMYYNSGGNPEASGGETQNSSTLGKLILLPVSQ